MNHIHMECLQCGKVDPNTHDCQPGVRELLFDLLVANEVYLTGMNEDTLNRLKKQVRKAKKFLEGE